MRTIGVLWVDERNRMTALGSPMGVIAGIIPVTNPTSTVLFKCMAAVKSGNAIVCAPHPRAARCSARAAEVMAEAAVKSGAPSGLISCLSEVTLQATGELMRHPDIALVMATGGPGMVRAAYSSGKPTLAVGAGNVPVYIHRSVKDIREAALMSIVSKSFDNGTACVAEQSIVLDEPVADAALAAFAAQGTVFLAPPEQERLAAILFTERGELRPNRSASQPGNSRAARASPRRPIVGCSVRSCRRSAPSIRCRARFSDRCSRSIARRTSRRPFSAVGRS